jgi:DNA-binding HxlR family transcriptional regulator
VRRKRLDHMDCSIAKALDLVGDPWTMLIVRDALLGVSRFEDFFTRLGVPRATLVARLDRLIECDVMFREPYQESPRRYAYRLTPKGEALRPVALTLMQWGDNWVRHDDPPTTLVDLDSGRTVVPALVDAETGRPFSEMRVRAQGKIADTVRGARTAASL